MKEGRQLVKEAVQDVKALKDAALQSAKNELIESLTPGLKALLEKEIKTALDEKRGLTGRIGQSQRGDYFSPKAQKAEESKEKGEEPMDNDKELDMESIAGFFPALAEEQPADGMPPEGEHPAMEGDFTVQHMQGMGIPMLGEEQPAGEPDGDEEPKMKDDEKKEGDMDEMGEHVEISTEELKRFYESALQTEVQVKKGFSDMVGGGELDQASKETGILDKKSGEAQWDTEGAPAAEKWIPENLQSLVKAGLAENKMLRSQLAESNKMLKSTILKLEEVNLFNAKVLHVNRLLNKHGRLNVEQKKVAVESLDKARSISEVKTIYEAIDKTFSLAGNLAEGKSAARKPTANAQRARTSGAPNEKVLRESVDRGGDAGNGRWKKLAGLVK